MAGFTVDNQIVPAQTLNAAEHTDLAIFLLQYRTLLDMHFEGGLERTSAGRLISSITNALELTAQSLARFVDAGIALVE